MGRIGLGINLDYARHAERSFEYAIKKAAALGYESVEPSVTAGHDLRAEAGLSPVLSLDDDPLAVRELCDSVNLKVSALAAPAPLMRPEVAIPVLRHAIRFASDLGAACVVTDEGLKPKGTDDRAAQDLIRYSLAAVLPTAERYKVALALEPHPLYAARLDAYLKLLDAVRSPALKISVNTATVHLAGQDPVEFFDAVADRLAHVHAADVQVESGRKDRARPPAAPLPCACGDGVIDWKKAIDVLDRRGYAGALSVSATSEEQADRGSRNLGGLLRAREAAGTPAPGKAAPKAGKSGKKKSRRR